MAVHLVICELISVDLGNITLITHIYSEYSTIHAFFNCANYATAY